MYAYGHMHMCMRMRMCMYARRGAAEGMGNQNVRVALLTSLAEMCVGLA